ncbi:MAG: RNA-directed DNA polymerase [Gammaproteobacteria bacterium]|nr:RNA-directed DNA polymerase [Gammaproteobacteria bacterium]
MVTVPKVDSGVRITTDLSPLNPYTVAEQHPIPNIKDILLDMRGAKVFTKLDLRKSFFHIMMRSDSRPLSTTVTHQGPFWYTRLPMGLKESAATMQRLVDQTWADCKACERSGTATSELRRGGCGIRRQPYEATL